MHISTFPIWPFTIDCDFFIYGIRKNLQKSIVTSFNHKREVLLWLIMVVLPFTNFLSMFSYMLTSTADGKEPLYLHTYIYIGFASFSIGFICLSVRNQWTSSQQ